MIMRGHVSSRLSRIGCVSIVMLIAMTLPAWAQRRTSPTLSTLPTSPSVPAVTVPAEGVPQVARPGRGVTAVEEVWSDAAEPPRQALPADAQRLIDRFAEQQAEEIGRASCRERV